MNSLKELVALMNEYSSDLFVKWDTPPLWPVAIPSVCGFFSACMPYIFQIPFFIEGSLISPFIFLILLSLGLNFSPPEIGNKIELIAGTWFSMLFSFLPQLFLFPWFIIVFLFWLAQSMYVWKRNYPPFRIGIWIGTGAISGLYIGSFFSHYILV